MVGEIPPVPLAEALTGDGSEAPEVDPIHGKERRPHGEGAGVAPLQGNEQLLQFKTQLQMTFRAPTPIVEVPGQDHGLVVWHVILNALGQRL